MIEKTFKIDTEPSPKGVKDGKIKGELTFIGHRYEKKDLDKFRKLFETWRDMSEAKEFFNQNSSSSKYGRGGVNLPEELSEGVVAKDINGVYRFRRQVKNKFGKAKFDCYNDQTKEIIEVKGCSIKPDLTSWTSDPYFDILYFVDFSSLDGKYKIYEIKITHKQLKKIKVSETQTFEDQTKNEKKMRPRFPIFKNFINPTYKCTGTPIFTGDIYE